MARSKFRSPRTLVYFVVTSLIVSIAGSNGSKDEVKLEGLPFCDEEIKQDKRYVLISTLDGKFSALNAENGGEVSWTLPTGPGPMLSSSIHRLELTNNGHWVRMIPSLSGHLYKFDGESIEAVPVNANQLLRNSFKYSEDLVISGGRETRTYGVDLDSGRLLYECKMNGCDNFTELADGHVLVVQRETQTIRAVEPRTGSERWNYSVAQHDVKLMSDPNADCHTRDKLKLEDLQIKVIVPEGLVCALSKKDPHKVLWKHKFDTPVTHAWQYTGGQVKALDLFSGSLMPPWSGKPSHPSLYIGMHQKQLYIQESVTVQHGVSEENVPLLTDERPSIRRIPWKPFPASSNAIGWPETKELPQITAGDSNSDSTTALSVLYASEYVNGNGFYLFNPGDEAAATTCDNETVIEPLDNELPELGEDETPVQIIIVSLWYWWKEVLIISMTTALLFNFFFTQRFLYLLQRTDVQQQILIVKTSSKQGSDSGMDLPLRGSWSDDNNTPNFSSRYLDDFEQVRCLGRGGFGVVFEARKQIDDCSYAVKRIALPNRKESRERVMREVKALAKLEHPHIVRYYHSWLECPPPGWQEEQDRGWLRELQSRDSLLPDDNTLDASTTTNQTTHNNNLLQVYRRDSEIAVTIPSDDSSIKNNAQDLSDSFIQFKDSSQSITPSPSKSRGAYVPLNLTNQGSSSESCEEESMSLPSDDSSPVRLRPTPMFLYIQMQLCRKESLREWLQKRNSEVPVRTDESLHVFHQITQAVEYVHLQGLIHRDLKPSNIFFSMDGHIKVGDFGLVTDSLLPSGVEDGHRTPSEEIVPWQADNDDRLERRHTANVGTKLYMSPEQMLGLPYDHKVDIYSLGLILFELLWPFSTQMERADALQALRDKLFPTDFTEQFKLESFLLVQMLSHAPDERPTAQEIRQRLPQPGQVCTS